MAVENLAIISSPLAGLAMNGALGGIQTWMLSNGIRPSHVAIGAVIGAIAHQEALNGALRGALIVGVVEAAYYYLTR